MLVWKEGRLCSIIIRDRWQTVYPRGRSQTIIQMKEKTQGSSISPFLSANESNMSRVDDEGNQVLKNRHKLNCLHTKLWYSIRKPRTEDLYTGASLSLSLGITTCNRMGNKVTSPFWTREHDTNLWELCHHPTRKVLKKICTAYQLESLWWKSLLQLWIIDDLG